MILLLLGCTQDFTLSYETTLPADPSMLSIPPDSVTCYGEETSGEGVVVWLTGIEPGVARYMPDWPDTNFWVDCPRPGIDISGAFCPSNIDGIDRTHGWDCFKMSPGAW